MKEQLTESIEKWKGKNVFYFNAKCFTGPTGIKQILMTSTFIFIPIALFLIFDSKWHSDNISIAVPIISAVLFILIVIFMSITTFSDPGILPRKIIGKHNKGQTMQGIFQSKKCKIVDLGYYRKIKICRSCGILRPFRSNHCADCDNCVEKFDHHCPWIGNCVAKRNYKYFFIFIALVNVLVFYIIVFSLIRVINYTNDYIKNDKTNSNKNVLIARSFSNLIISIFLILYCLATLIFVGGLFIYHIKLVIRNLTTKEDLKGFYNNAYGNPYYKISVFHRCRQAFFPRVSSPSFLEKIRINLEEVKLKMNEEVLEKKNEANQLNTNNKNDYISTKPINTEFLTEAAILETRRKEETRIEKDAKDDKDLNSKFSDTFSNRNNKEKNLNSVILHSPKTKEENLIGTHPNNSLNETKKVDFHHKIVIKKI